MEHELPPMRQDARLNDAPPSQPGSPVLFNITAGAGPPPAPVRQPTEGKAYDRSLTSVSMSAYHARPKYPVHHPSEAFEVMSTKSSLILSPPEIYAECAHHGEEKALFNPVKMLLLSIIAGCYVGFGFTLCLIVGGNLSEDIQKNNRGLFYLVFGAVGFPFAFTMIVVCGAELYTSMCAYGMAAWWEGKITPLTALRLLAITWCGNFAGCGVFVGLMVAAGTYHGKDEYTLTLAESKVSHTWGETLVRGIFANWLVGIATWQANAAQDLTGKFIAIWLPISAFAMIGFEHCIANQFVIPMAMALGADISATQFIWHNLIPATIGNWIGGAICVASLYAWVYGTPAKKVEEFFVRRRAKSS